MELKATKFVGEGRISYIFLERSIGRYLSEKYKWVKLLSIWDLKPSYLKDMKRRKMFW